MLKHERQIKMHLALVEKSWEAKFWNAPAAGHKLMCGSLKSCGPAKVKLCAFSFNTRSCRLQSEWLFLQCTKFRITILESNYSCSIKKKHYIHYIKPRCIAFFFISTIERVFSCRLRPTAVFLLICSLSKSD